jgi:hypothetical protein
MTARRRCAGRLASFERRPSRPRLIQHTTQPFEELSVRCAPLSGAFRTNRTDSNMTFLSPTAAGDSATPDQSKPHQGAVA